jgi:hypothetical protein
MSAPVLPPQNPASRLRASNRRTALVLAAIAATFFVGVIGSKFMGGQAMGLSVLGIAVLLFLVTAIGRNLSSKR